MNPYETQNVTIIIENFIRQSLPFFHFLLPFVSLIILALLVWSIYWKGRALWKAARQNDKIWFIVLLVVNTVGILEILYIYLFSKKKENTSPIA